MKALAKVWLQRILYVFILGLIGACIIHILIILLVPVFASQNIWERLTVLGPERHFYTLKSSGLTSYNDPLMQASACIFDLNDGPVYIRSSGKVPFWSLAIYNHAGEAIFSVNDQVNTGMEPDILLVNPAQKIRFEANQNAIFSKTLITSHNINQGIVVLRSLVPDSSWKGEIHDFLTSATCSAPVLNETSDN